MRLSVETLAKCTGSHVTRRRDEKAEKFLARVTHVKVAGRSVQYLVCSALQRCCGKGKMSDRRPFLVTFLSRKIFIIASASYASTLTTIDFHP